MAGETLAKCFSIAESITNMLHLQQLQAQMTKLALDRNTLAMSKLVAFSAISDQGDLKYACSILTHMEKSTNFMWNVVIRGFSHSQEPQSALFWYSKMIQRGHLPDKFSFPFLLKACSRLLDLRTGQQVHCQIIKLGPSSDPHVDASLLHLYTNCGQLEVAEKVFEKLSQRGVVAWNVMISGCLGSGRLKEAFGYYHQMRLANENPDEFTLVGFASACANLGALSLGKWVHGLAYGRGFCGVVPLGNALADMYGKCGIIDDACKLFNEISFRNIVSWSTMIDVYAMHGRAKRALDMLIEMENVGIKPDEMLFTSVLCACSHAGLLDEGKMCFDRMIREYGITPKIQHYGCLVDLLGKAGLLKKAYGLIIEMPIEPDAAIWRLLVGACLFHGNLELAEVSADQLRRSSPDDTGDLVILSNVYARLGRWEDVGRLRRRLRKNSGCSFIDLDDGVHEFVTGDESHPKSYEIRLLIYQISFAFADIGWS